MKSGKSSHLASTPFYCKILLGSHVFSFSFILSNWRWLDREKCSKYPREYTCCAKYNSSFHVLFECTCFLNERDIFFQRSGVPFGFKCLKIDDRLIAREAAIVGKSIFSRICEYCDAMLSRVCYTSRALTSFTNH